LRVRPTAPFVFDECWLQQLHSLLIAETELTSGFGSAAHGWAGGRQGGSSKPALLDSAASSNDLVVVDRRIWSRDTSTQRVQTPKPTVLLLAWRCSTPFYSSQCRLVACVCPHALGDAASCWCAVGTGARLRLPSTHTAHDFV